jgi:hypothetical protein
LLRERGAGRKRGDDRQNQCTLEHADTPQEWTLSRASSGGATPVNSRFLRQSRATFRPCLETNRPRRMPPAARA